MGEKPKLERSLKCYLKYGAIISPLGDSIEEHYSAFLENKSGIKKEGKIGFNSENFFLARIDNLANSRYNTLLNQACEKLIQNYSSSFLQNPKTGVIVSTTKANLAAITSDTFESTRRIIDEIIHPFHEPIIISNACISGVLAVNTAADYIRLNKFDQVIIIGIDVLSDFIIYGFQSLFALSNEACRPFDKERNGISLGEACGIIVMMNTPDDDCIVEVLGGASSNDANHISGPSRTGEGLFRAIHKSLERSGILKEEIDFISAHGTATTYNDEMEAIAFNRLGLNHIPTNSFKGYFGHTLGAAGIIEIIMCMVSMEKNILFKSIGYTEIGTSERLNVISENQKVEVTTVLKTASGFGGGNAAVLLKCIQ